MLAPLATLCALAALPSSAQSVAPTSSNTTSSNAASSNGWTARADAAHDADAGSTAPAAPAGALAVARSTGRLAPLFGASVSAGAARLGDAVYVYGGHLGRAHSYDRESLSGAFARASTSDLAKWETLPGGPPRQGVALVAAGERLLRVGGLEARNAPGTDSDLWSDDAIDAWRPGDGAWSTWGRMPAARSSHDAIVHDGRLYVAGGWTVENAKRTFLREMWIATIDAAAPTWERVEQPFERRGLAVVAHAGRIWCLGGMEDDGEQSARVDVYDPAQRTWQRGPDLPGAGFGCAACSVGDELVVALGDGALARWNAKTAQWSGAGSLAVSRRFHRMVALGSDAFVALGGTNGAHRETSEAWPLSALTTPGPRVCTASVAWGSDARQRSGVALAGDTLLAFGGNRYVEDHQFDVDDFSDASRAIDLLTLRVRELPALPEPRQSMQVGIDAEAQKATLYGGFGPGPEGAYSRDEIWELDLAQASWKRLEHGLPSPLTQFQVATVGGDTWLLGGLAFAAGSKSVPKPSTAVWKRATSGAAFVEAAFALPAPRRAFACAVSGKTLNVVGGMADRFAPIATCLSIEPANGSVNELPQPLRARVGADLVAIDGTLYLACGSGMIDGNLESCDELERLMPGATTWDVVLPTLPVAMPHARMLRYGQSLLFVSASRESGVLDVALVKP